MSIKCVNSLKIGLYHKSPVRQESCCRQHRQVVCGTCKCKIQRDSGTATRAELANARSARDSGTATRAELANARSARVVQQHVWNLQMQDPIHKQPKEEKRKRNLYMPRVLHDGPHQQVNGLEKDR